MITINYKYTGAQHTYLFLNLSRAVMLNRYILLPCGFRRPSRMYRRANPSFQYLQTAGLFFFFSQSEQWMHSLSFTTQHTHTHRAPRGKNAMEDALMNQLIHHKPLKKKNTHEIHYFTHTHTHTLRCAWWIQKTYCGELFCVSSLNFWNFFLPSRHCQLCLDLTALPKSMHVLKATYVAMPWSMIPPNRTAVVWSSRSGYWGKKRCSSNKFLSMHWNTSCENKTKSIHTHRPHCNHCITL